MTQGTFKQKKYRNQKRAIVTARKDVDTTSSQDLLLWIVLLIGVLLIVVTLIYGSSCRVVKKYMPAHTIYYMVGKMPVSELIPEGEQETIECR